MGMQLSSISSHHNAGACRRAEFSLKEAQDLLRESGSTANKQALRDSTDEAIQHGAFGVPYIHVEGDGIAPEDSFFWGADRLEQMAHVLGKPWLGIPNAKHTSKL
jgi:2-hydroxychromene-2-carboxylate isomerase